MRKRALLSLAMASCLFSLSACTAAPDDSDLGPSTDQDYTDNAKTGNTPKDDAGATSPGVPGQGGNGDGGASMPTPPPGGLAAALDKPTLDAELRSVVVEKVTVTADSGFTGSATLSVTGLPENVTAAFTPSATITPTAAGASAMLTLTIPVGAQIASSKIVVKATSGAKEATANAVLNVKPVITITIPERVSTMPNGTGVFGAYPTTLNIATINSTNPVTVLVMNADSVPHEIHASGTNGFIHSQKNIPAGMADTPRKVTGKGTYDFYLHDEGSAKHMGRLVIQ